MKRWLIWGGVVFALLAISTLASGDGLSWPRYPLGATVLFYIDTQHTCWWCCCGCCDCACPEVTVSGWRILNSAGNTIYASAFETPIPAAAFDGRWEQVDNAGGAVAVGTYILYVDTSTGTLTQCLQVYDPCGRCWSWPCCSCTTNVQTTHCCCRTTLVLSAEQVPCPMLVWPCCSSCP